MRRTVAALIAAGTIALILIRALAAPTLQPPDCSASLCVHLPFVLKPVATPTATPTTAPAIVRVVSSRSYVRSTSRSVVGEVQNGFSFPVYSVNISARFYDAADAVVAVESGYTILIKTAPGEKNPFKILLSNAPPSIVRYDLSVTYQNTSILSYQPLTILSQQVRDNFGPEVFGELHNDQAREVRGVQLAVTFYDANGKVFDTDFGFPASLNLAAGTQSTYKVSTFTSGLTFTSYAVQAQGYLTP